MDYETESQKECQDILDSVGDMVDFERSQERASCPSDQKNSSKSSSEYVIPQVDGCGDDDFSTPFDGSVGSFSEIEGKSEFRTSSHQVQDASSSFNHKHKRKKLWGSLPFSETSKMKTEGEHASLHIETRDPNGTSSSSENEAGKRAGSGTCDAKDSGMLARCSVRDLMRRKRSYRVEPPESSGREENEDTLLCAKRLDFQVSGADELDRKPHESSNFRLSLADQQSGSYKAYKYDSKPTNPGCSLYGKLPLCSSSNDNILHASTLDGKLDSSVLIGEEVGAGATAQFRNSLIRGPSQVPSVNKRIQTWSAEHEVADVDGYVESGFESLSSKVGVYKMSFENPMRANATTVSAVLNNERTGVQKLGRDSVSSELRHLPPEFIYLDAEDLIGMTFHKKPPVPDWKDRASKDASSLYDGITSIWLRNMFFKEWKLKTFKY